MFIVVAVSVFFISLPYFCSRNGATFVQILGKGYLQGRLKLTIVYMQIRTELGIFMNINVTKVLDMFFPVWNLNFRIDRLFYFCIERHIQQIIFFSMKL